MVGGPPRGDTPAGRERRSRVAVPGTGRAGGRGGGARGPAHRCGAGRRRRRRARRGGRDRQVPARRRDHDDRARDGDDGPVRPGRAGRPAGRVPPARGGAARRRPVGPGPRRAGARGLPRPPRPDRARLARRSGPSADDSPVLLGEGMARLLGVLGRDRGCVLVLEDLHWADPETLDAVDYLADALSRRPGALPVHEPTRGRRDRARGAGCGSVTRARRSRSTPLLARRGRRDGGRVPADDLVPPELRAFLRTHSEGVPFLVEELLAGLVASGALRPRRRALGRVTASWSRRCPRACGSRSAAGWPRSTRSRGG